jgi:hypothetical protein
MVLFVFPYCQRDQKLNIVGLDRRLVSGAVAVYLSATGALMDDHVSFFGIGLNANGLHQSHALAGAVSGIYINVYRPKAKGAVVSGAVSQGLHVLTAMGAGKAAIVL